MAAPTLAPATAAVIVSLAQTIPGATTTVTIASIQNLCTNFRADTDIFVACITKGCNAADFAVSNGTLALLPGICSSIGINTDATTSLPTTAELVTTTASAAVATSAPAPATTAAPAATTAAASAATTATASVATLAPTHTANQTTSTPTSAVSHVVGFGALAVTVVLAALFF
ncbi:hypothetical protein HDU98_000908 [Podochytrium sp. JEL0797]|nr:hypothetical protein HDU98_000908 [Podochytrium sp. JEL0797]